MSVTEINRGGVEPSFAGIDGPLPPSPTRVCYRTAYYHLINVEEHPETLPLAYDLARKALGENAGAWANLTSAPADANEVRASLGAIEASLSDLRGAFARPWRQGDDELTRRQVLHYLVQFMPTAFVDGCWLQCGLRVSTAHTRIGAALTGLYQHQVRAFVADPGRHFVADYRSVYERLGARIEEISSRSFANRIDFQESSFALPILLLASAQFTRSFPAEILGLNLAWQFMDLSAFGPDLVRDTTTAYGLPLLGGTLRQLLARDPT